ncbi:hypothetical protein QL285_037228 [Trifolium repens]|nr:hypothetical protein QL285_037228 [Trifolium repens]
MRSLFTNGRDREEHPNRGRNHHHDNRKTKRRRSNNEFQSQEDSQDSETIIDPPPPPPYVLPTDHRQPIPDFAPEDANLLTEFATRHPSFLLSERTHSPVMKRTAYEYFTGFFKFLQSQSTLDLLTTLKSSVSGQLNVLRLYGFKGEWLDELELRLSRQIPLDEEFEKLTELEASYSKHICDMEEEYELLTQRLVELRGKVMAGKETMDYLSNRKKTIMDDRASLNVPFTF